MRELISVAIQMGWPALSALLGLFLYFALNPRSSVGQKRHALFKTGIGLLATVLILLAIANYRLNFFERAHLLPISLFLVAASFFILAVYFHKASLILRVSGVTCLMAGVLSAYGNYWFPQVEGAFGNPHPPYPTSDGSWMTVQQLADEGEKIIFGGIGQSKVNGAVGKGQCPICHAFNEGERNRRGPHLLGIVERAKERLQDPRYQKGVTPTKDHAYADNPPLSGTATTTQEYLAESYACPDCYIVDGPWSRGTGERESTMPILHLPPISLTLPELAAIDTWLYVREGYDAPRYDTLLQSYEKYIPEKERPRAPQSELPDREHQRAFLMVGGVESLETIFAKAQCGVCHVIPGIMGTTGAIGPPLHAKTLAERRLKDPAYAGHATTVREYITESILTPGADVSPTYPDKVMPRVYGELLSAAALNRMVDYLSQVEEGKDPPKL